MHNFPAIKLFFFFALIFSGCKKFNNIDPAPSTDHLTSNAKIQRFDIDLIQVDTNDVEKSVTQLKSKYPALFEIYFTNVLGMDMSKDSLISQIRAYLVNPTTRDLYDTINLIYPNLELTNKEFQSAFKYMQHYFPGYQEPNLYSVVSGFGYQKFIFKDIEKDGIGIALDMYLGATFPYKAIDPKNPSFSEYLTRTFNQEHIVKKSIELLVEDLVGYPNGVRLLDLMINNGKKLFILDKLLPNTPDTIIIEYSESQLDWCVANEQKIWSFLIDENLLYETNLSKINKYVNPSPSSPGMPDEAPGRTANFIGWQIVKAYMKKFPNTTMKELIQVTDSQGFLEKSRYRP